MRTRWRALLVRGMITFNVCLISLFFKIRAAGCARDARYWASRAFVDDMEQVAPGRVVRAAPRTHTGPKGALLGLERTEPLRAEALDAFAKRCRPSARSNLPKIDAHVRKFYLFTHLLLWYMLAKNFALGLLRSDSFAEWRFIDCLLLGRFTINARVLEMTPQLACLEALIWLLWRYTMMHARPAFRLPVVEFLLADRAQVGAPSCEPAPGPNLAPLAAAQSKLASRATGKGSMQTKMQTNAQAHYQLRWRRPNRTREAWDALASMTLIFYAITISVGLALMPPFLRMCLPVVFTQRGFAHNYRHCIHWLVARRRTRAAAMETAGVGHAPAPSWRDALIEELLDDSFIGRNRSAETTLAPGLGDGGGGQGRATQAMRNTFMDPSEPLVEFSKFHALRAALELSETLTMCGMIGLSFNAVCFMPFILSKDVRLYSDSINARLRRLIVGRPHAPWADPSPLGPLDALDPLSPLKIERPTKAASKQQQQQQQQDQERGLAAESTPEIQAQMADLFNTLDGYNKFTSLQALCLLAFWLGYSALVCSWIFIPGNENPKSEWYGAHVIATLYYFVMLWGMSRAKASTLHMYKLTTTLMAQGGQGAACKRTWAALLQFYAPRPMYCFTMMGTIELTKTSGLQLVGWLFGALVVASSFFQVHNIK